MPVFNEKQKEAITCDLGPAMILAGPGSGKTFVLASRIRYLVEDKNIPASNILVITFSKSAAFEMQQRFLQLTNNQFYPVTFGTFHSIFFQIIKRTYHYQNKDILTILQKRFYLKKVILERKVFENIDTDLLDSILRRIAYYKNSNKHEDKEQELAIKKEIFLDLYTAYQKLLLKEHKLDFEDMMLLCYKLLSDNSEILQFYQNQFQFILVDEFQDINFIQYEILKLLSQRQKNLFIVGDDDQSIYKFRGASPNIMKQFEADYPDSKKIILNVNYRSTKEIIKHSALVIQENKNRFLKSSEACKSQRDSVMLKGFESKEEEYAFLLERLVADCKSKCADRTACLFRTNIEASGFAELLLEKKIPFTMKEKLLLTYENTVFLDFYHYFLLVDNEEPYRVEDFIPIMNKPVRYINRGVILNDEVRLTDLKSAYKSKSYMLSILQKFEYDLRRMKRMDLFARTNYIRRAMGYDEYVFKNGENKTIEETINRIQIKMKDFSNITELKLHMEKLKQQENQNTNVDGVHIMTFHASKGLEFDKVYIPDCNEGYIPNRKSIGEEEIEEERRMFYVAMTRAKESLNIYYVKGNKQTIHMPSRFLYPLLKEKNPE